MFEWSLMLRDRSRKSFQSQIASKEELQPTYHQTQQAVRNASPTPWIRSVAATAIHLRTARTVDHDYRSFARFHTIERTQVCLPLKCARSARAEYDDPENRRFHAQPNACYACGPKAWLERSDGKAICIDTFSQLDQVDAVCTLLKRGEIVAIKGIGGFHLACDATNRATVEKLRRRKRRFHKPLALMARDLTVIERYCQIEEVERKILQHASAPIVLLTAKTDLSPGVAPISEHVALAQNTLGFMLPYTPLHHLILKRMDRPVVFTSGNLSDEPQCTNNEEARERLASIADYFMFHDREIVNRLDDSVVHVSCGQPALIRRARGFAPTPISLPAGFDDAPNLLAMGAELKSTFC